MNRTERGPELTDEEMADCGLLSELAEGSAADSPAEAPAPTLQALARRCLWIAYVWNDHNFEPAHRYAVRTAEECGIFSLEDANRWLAQPVAESPAPEPLTEREAARCDAWWASLSDEQRNAPQANVAWNAWLAALATQPQADM